MRTRLLVCLTFFLSLAGALAAADFSGTFGSFPSIWITTPATAILHSS